MNQKQFDFERFTDHEDFIIKAKSMFDMTEDLAETISFLSKVDNEAAIKTEDDGVTQQVRIKTGLSGAMTEGKTVKSIVRLAPYRTFRDIKQPEGNYLFRMKRRSEEVSCAFFEADGGQWEIEAINSIKEFFKDSGVPVIG